MKLLKIFGYFYIILLQTVPKTYKLPITIAVIEENLPKNRYKNILPCKY